MIFIDTGYYTSRWSLLMEKTFNSDDNLAKIRKYTARPDIVPLLAISHLDGNLATYDCDSGTATGRGILNIPELAIVEVEMSANCSALEHNHDVVEIITVVTGQITINVQKPDGELGTSRIILNPHESYTIPIGASHIISCKEPSKIICISIPPDAGFPDGK